MRAPAVRPCLAVHPSGELLTLRDRGTLSEMNRRAVKKEDLLSVIVYRPAGHRKWLQLLTAEPRSLFKSYWWFLQHEAHEWDQGFVVLGDTTTRMSRVPTARLAGKWDQRSQRSLKYYPQLLVRGSAKPAEFPREWHYQNLSVSWLHRLERKNNISSKWTDRVQRDNKHLNSTWKTSSSAEL